MPVIVNDEIAETSGLTNEELGALVRLKWAMWKSGGWLPDDGKQLARVARAGSRWGKIAPAVLALFTIGGGKVSSPSLLNTLLITRERRAKNVKAVRARWSKPEVPLNASNPLIGHDSTPADVSVGHALRTSNQNQNKKDPSFYVEDRAVAALGEAAGPPKKAGSTPGSNEALHETLYVHGCELLVSRVGVRLLQARAQISRWLVQVSAEDLARVLADADVHNLQGASFVNVVDKRVAAIAAEKLFGGSLRFPIGEVKAGNG
jgi:uncharacterized protein YdaU (DUF1376 family)